MLMPKTDTAATKTSVDENKERKRTGRKKRSKRFLKVLCVSLCFLVCFIAVTTAVTVVGDRKNLEKIRTIPSASSETALKPEKDENGYWTFTTDKPFKILQLTDIHIGAGWMSLKKDAQAFNAVAAMVTAEKPDLVIVTGDISYPVPFQSGTFNNKSSAKLFAALMEQLGVCWTVAFGNHDAEAYSYYSRDEIGDFYESEEFSHCLFEKGPDEVDGIGNQIINIKNSAGLITQSIFIFDSHSYTDTDPLGIRWKYDNIHENQIEWYSDSLDRLNEQNRKVSEARASDINSLAFFHIPPAEMRKAWNEYSANGYRDTENVRLIYGFANGNGKMVFCPVHDDNLIETMLEKGSTKGVFFGHDHKNCLSFDYHGIRLTYAMSIDYLAIPGIGRIGAQRGCTVITVNPDGSFDSRNENYYQDKYPTVFEKESVKIQEVTYE